MPQLLEKVDIGLKKMRRHFVNDPEALKHWDNYEENVRYAFRNHLSRTLMWPACLPVSSPIHLLYFFRVRFLLQSKSVAWCSRLNLQHLDTQFGSLISDDTCAIIVPSQTI